MISTTRWVLKWGCNLVPNTLRLFFAPDLPHLRRCQGSSRRISVKAVFGLQNRDESFRPKVQFEESIHCGNFLSDFWNSSSSLIENLEVEHVFKGGRYLRVEFKQQLLPTNLFVRQSNCT